MRWQQYTKIVLVLVGVVVVAAIALTVRRRGSGSPPPVAVRSDPKAVVESTKGRAIRFNGTHEDVRIEAERILTYDDGSTKVLHVKISSADRGDGKSFTLTADEGVAGKDEAILSLAGHVTLIEGDGFTAETDNATYDSHENIMRAPGAITFHHGRLSGSGMGMVYEKATDVLTIAEHAVMHMAANAAGKGVAEVTSGHATFAREDHLIEFTGGVHVQRDAQVIDSANAITYLTDDDQRITVLELHGNASIAGNSDSAGGLQGMTGQNVTLEYADDGQAIQHALVSGAAVIKLSGGAGKAGREISAGAIDVMVGPDGATPTALIARERVTLTLAADGAATAKTVTAAMLTASSNPKDPARGLTRATFTGNVDYRERSATINRTARAALLDVGLKAAMASFERATFTGAARFEDGKVVGTASSLDYQPDEEMLALKGSEPSSLKPHVVNDQISVDATTIEVKLAGPVMVAKGDVQSVLQPPKKTAAADGARLPSMLKQDSPVNVIAESLTFDGDANTATYDGNASLWQTDTTVKGMSISINSKTGNMSASGSVLTTTLLDQTDKDKKKTHVRSTASAKRFAYDDKARRATYTGDVHFSQAQADNDLSAEVIDLYLKPTGNELERAVATHPDNGLVLREQGRRTTGSKMTFSAANDRYDFLGAPVEITDQCGRTTTGRTVVFKKATDTIEIEGNRRVRTQTKNNGSKCQ